MSECLTINLESLADTDKLASKLTLILKGGGIVGLSGQLGSGKTTFTKSLVRALGGDENEVSSPSYVLEQLYEAKGLEIHHWDLYRVKSTPQELDLNQKNKLTLIEWPENGLDVNQELDLHLIFRLTSDNLSALNEKRVVEVSGRMLPTWQAALKRSSCGSR